ncbi:amidohydrolase family protein [Engelhardtia mirabilis]|uniref:Atrazine chlorohydrolase n=1 Tax=Engelhardtia mirabilis TaxID=2528011 RepID=A0A518BNK4_9BACT|nr:Atrazine chlorohydrolase [Planctomycetes bacterium Pla133]QDV02862.1 Atrazine chlorohydrolase [Planctomycetes bacterium Pla86]
MKTLLASLVGVAALALAVRPSPALEHGQEPGPDTASAQPENLVAFVGATLLPITAPAIDDGVIVVRDGRIAAIGARGEVEIPAGAELIDATGRTIMPGLICTHSHVGAPFAADSSDPIQPEARSLDSMDVRASSVHRARAGGLTTLNCMPGSGHLMSGQTVYLKLRLAVTVEELAYRFEDGSIMGGLKMANGTNPQGDKPFPGTRAKSAALVRQKFIDAVAYRDKLRAAADDPEVDAPARDLGLEALVEVLDGKRIVHHHTHRHDDILTVLRLAEEFGFRVVLHHVSEGWRVADEIAAAGVPCSVIVVDSPGGKQEATRLSFDTCRVLDEAGVRVALHTDDYITDSRLFLRSGALAVRAGLSEQKALEALTIAGAEMLDLDGRVGSLEVGKDADLAVLDGHPFSVYTQVLETWVEGERVFDLSDPDDLIYSIGGPGAGDDVPFTQCCANVR